ncbi:acyltransferase [Steroidobacter sp. S1-65]|uniref:Acyltransferase n=1 Tax=Steroidobacter gossypii TaxID=2805490 RepID=A0ABS1X6F4_9GAMM|nr:acyltransferase [Steroidobacter gossypii]MBM0108807.1 acyltransferase [Steroidobacter gossypii]
MSWLRIAFGTLLLTTNTLLHVPPLLLVALVKAIAPLRPIAPLRAIRRGCDSLLMGIAANWIGINTTLIRWFTRTRFTVDIDARLRPDGHYLVLANHQTWVDIPVLQAALNRRVPLLRFFLKSQLFWVPLLGLAWWALDFPFMKRYSRQQLEQRPELAGRDIAATRRACAKFMHIPVAVMNFVEGTRFTAAKHAHQASPFAHLLKPKAGGVAFVLDAMGGALHSILDVTIVYPDGRPSMLDLFANRVREVRVNIRERPIPAELLGGNYQNDPAFRERMQAWLNELWGEKDRLIAELRAA